MDDLIWLGDAQFVRLAPLRRQTSPPLSVQFPLPIRISVAVDQTFTRY
jgi:hypothetical protein